MPARTKLMIFISILLLLLLILFAYLFIILTKPLQVNEGPPEPMGLKHLFSIYGNGKDLLDKPNGVAFDEEGNIYIADTGKHRILIFSSSGAFKKKIEAKDKLKYPLGVGVDEDDNIYVTSMQSSKLFVFSPEGSLIREKPLDRPITFTIVGHKIYITTPGQVWVTDLEGNILQKWGHQGRNPGEFEYPNGIAVDKQGNIYVSDTNNTRIQAFNKDTDLIWTTGKPPKSLNDRSRSLGLPAGLTMGLNNYLYLVDAFHFNIKVFNKSGKELSKLGDRGQTEGRFNYPAGIAFDGDNTYAVADKYNNRVQVLRISVE